MRGLKRVERLSLLLVLAGISTIYAASALFMPETVSVGELGEEEVGSYVRVAGTVEDLSSTEDGVFFRLTGDKGSIRAVHFGTGLGIAEGESHTFEGRVDIYQGEREIVVENVVSGENPDNQPG